jgi:hypothetical protein
MEHVMPNKFFDPYDIEVKDEVLNAQDVRMPEIDGVQLLNANIVNTRDIGKFLHNVAPYCVKFDQAVMSD